MAWFKKTLEDMKNAVDTGDWEMVRKIYSQHRGDLNVESHLVEQDLSSITGRLNKYGEALDQIGNLLKLKTEPDKMDINLHIKQAIDATHFFEATIKHHIALGRFIEEKMK
jgi:hypothetical protein